MTQTGGETKTKGAIDLLACCYQKIKACSHGISTSLCNALNSKYKMQDSVFYTILHNLSLHKLLFQIQYQYWGAMPILGLYLGPILYYHYLDLWIPSKTTWTYPELHTVSICHSLYFSIQSVITLVLLQISLSPTWAITTIFSSYLFCLHLSLLYSFDLCFCSSAGCLTFLVQRNGVFYRFWHLLSIRARLSLCASLRTVQNAEPLPVRRRKVYPVQIYTVYTKAL